MYGDERAMRLRAKVKAVNRCHEVSMKLQRDLIDQFEPLVGLPILKKDGQFLAKYGSLASDVIPTGDHSLHVYRHTNDYTLAWTVKTSEQCSDLSCLYYAHTFYVGELSGCTLRKMSQPSELRTDFTDREIFDNREKFKEAEQALSNARGRLHPFGEYDR